MSLRLGEVTLWLAAAACALIGLRVGPRPEAPAGERSPRPPVPVFLRVACRVPCPPGFAARMVRPADDMSLGRAGLGGVAGPADLGRMRAGLATVGALGASLLCFANPTAIVAAPILVGAGAALPGRWIVGRRRARGRAIVRELPDLLDLLGICIEAGMALDPALRLATARLGGTLGAEVGILLRDLSLGAPRRSAYRALIERTGVPEIARTVGALLQAEELGAPLSGALEGQASLLREARRQAARESAARAAPKIQLVVALLMVPAVLLLVLGILLIELSRQVGAVVG